jgi:hypothetical protein
VLKRKSGLALVAILVGLSVFSSPATGKEAKVNLVPNPEFRGSQVESGLPEGWHRDTRKIPGVEPSRVYFCRVTGHSGKLLALEGGPDRNGRVWCRIKHIRPRTDYLLEFVAYRLKYTNGVSLEVEIFGQRHVINQHLSYGRVQPIFLRINSGTTRGTTVLTISNPHREVLVFGSPSLRTAGPSRENIGAQANSLRLPNFFPVGIYGASPGDLAEIRSAGFNAVQSYESRPDTIRRMAATSARLGLKYLANVRGDQADISRELGGRPEILGFYLEDEPEGGSVPPKRIEVLKESLKRDHPEVLTAVAMLRSQMVAEYKDAADVFMVDPYPVPNMPMTWLADSLEEAARHVPQERLWAVVQAFGGAKWAKEGWPRPPTYMEMRCLTYLAVVHGAHGLFYWSYPEVRTDSPSWEALKKIVAELRQLRTWLVVPAAPKSLQLELTSPFKVDAVGQPAVHFCQKSRGTEDLLILVNVIDRPVSFYLHGVDRQVPWLTEVFQQRKSVVRDRNIRDELGPYEVRIYLYSQGD